jgi:hypothetical protein
LESGVWEKGFSENVLLVFHWKTCNDFVTWHDEFVRTTMSMAENSPRVMQIFVLFNGRFLDG